MPRLIVLSAAEQVAAHLRDEVLRGKWSGLMPGGDRLASDLGIGRDTVEAALRRLEEEGLLVNEGRRRRRRIELPSGAGEVAPIRVAILIGEKGDRKLDYVVELQHQLVEAGHVAFYAPRSMTELGMEVKRIESMVEKTKADAWVVVAGSHDVLEWFASLGKPAFAMFGRRRGLSIAGAWPDKPPAMMSATRALIDLGHRKIVLLARSRRRFPMPGAGEQAFLDELAACGIAPGPYHLPDWKETADGFHGRLESLFRLTPPTAMIIDGAPLFIATLEFCASQGLKVPRDISLVCTDPDPTFTWCRPSIAHIHWESAPVVRRVVGWVANVSRGKRNLRQTFTPAEFVPGGTIGPVGKTQT